MKLHGFMKYVLRIDPIPLAVLGFLCTSSLGQYADRGSHRRCLPVQGDGETFTGLLERQPVALETPRD